VHAAAVVDAHGAGVLDGSAEQRVRQRRLAGARGAERDEGLPWAIEVRERRRARRSGRVDGDALLASFADVATLAARCRFRDCAHQGEPGCAVQGGVDADRLHNYQKLLREHRRDALTWVERRQQVAAWKSRGKDARVRMRMKRGDQ